MDTHAQPPAEAELIRSRREACDPPLSRRQAAAKAGISPSQWSDVERGCKQAGSGVTIPVQAMPETLARMAEVVGASAGDLAAAGREDAAKALRALAEDKDLRARIAAVPGLGDILTPPLTSSGGAQLLPLIAECLEAVERSGLPRHAQRELTGLFVDNLIHDAARRRAELLLMIRLADARRTG